MRHAKKGGACQKAPPLRHSVYAYSRIAQHSAKPTQAALDAAFHVFRYLDATKTHAITIPQASQDRSVFDFDKAIAEEPDWRFFTDTDHAGNAEVQNKRRSQNGFLATRRTVPVDWYSKASSVAFATPLIGEAHADTSSAAVEIYGAGNATQGILSLSYIAEEMNKEFNFPVKLEMDNAAAKIFCDGSASKTRLKHIDARQEWIQTLRNRDLFIATHIPSEENLADLFTKILPKAVFVYLRDKVLKPLPETIRVNILKYFG